MRTTSMSIACWVVLQLAGCAEMRTVARTGPCAGEAGIECQVERSARVP
jgi:hypothetical protein